MSQPTPSEIPTPRTDPAASGDNGASGHPVLLFSCRLSASGSVEHFDATGALLNEVELLAGLQDEAPLVAALATSARDLGPFVIDLRFRLATGEAAILEAHLAPAHAADGTLWWRAAAVDVTERRRSERLLGLMHRASLAIVEAPDHRTAVDGTLRNMCAVADAQYGEAWLSDPTESHLVLGPVYHDGSEAWARFEAGSRAVHYGLDVGPIGLCWRTRRPFWAEDVTTLVDDAPQRPALPQQAAPLSIYLQPIVVEDSVLGVFAVYLDRRGLGGVADLFATVAGQLGAALQRRHIEQELAYANIIVEQSPTVVYRALATEGAPRVYTSRNVTRFGYSVEDCKRGRFNFPGFVHEEDRPRVLAEVQRMLDDGGDVFEQEYRLITASGEIRCVHDRTVAIRDAARQITHWQGALTDITERWRREDELADANIRLEVLSLKLSKYLSPQIYHSIFSGQQEAKISTQRKKLTIFFSDIADFTSTTDGLESEELTTLLNHYLTEMSNIALSHGATIDKYIGDAILAFFGDPESRGARDDALACVRMAIDMQRRMRELQHEWRNVGTEKPFELRIGINTGFCTVGNFGSDDRMDYTVIGGEVNLAARLQSHAERGGILLGHETWSLVKSEIDAEELTPVTVKGFAAPVRLYRVLDSAGDGMAGREVVHYRSPGASLDVDIARLESGERDALALVVEELGKRLRDGGA